VPAARAAGLTKTYSGPFGRAAVEALRGVDLEVPRGTAFGLIGLNGAGKTTLIKILLGIVRPSAGSIRLLDGDPNDPAVRARIGYLPERLALPQTWTPPAFLASVARLKGLRGFRDEIERQLARVGLASDADRRIGGFSKGMKQRLGLAAALLGAPELLVLDEPSDGVDPLGRVEIRKMLAEERSRGATLLLNSHLLSETERICDRIAIMSEGRLVREGPLDELCGKSTRWRVRFAPGFARERLTALGFQAYGSDFHCEAADAEALNALLDRARSTGALLLELGRELRELEEVLTETLSPPGPALRPPESARSTEAA
jgi:ABC-2 type transport system ATP-binding protein